MPEFSFFVKLELVPPKLIFNQVKCRLVESSPGLCLLSGSSCILIHSWGTVYQRKRVKESVIIKKVFWLNVKLCFICLFNLLYIVILIKSERHKYSIVKIKAAAAAEAESSWPSVPSVILCFS